MKLLCDLRGRGCGLQCLELRLDDPETSRFLRDLPLKLSLLGLQTLDLLGEFGGVDVGGIGHDSVGLETADCQTCAIALEHEHDAVGAERGAEMVGLDSLVAFLIGSPPAP